MERHQTYGVSTGFTNFKNEECDIKLLFTGKKSVNIVKAKLNNGGRAV